MTKLLGAFGVPEENFAVDVDFPLLAGKFRRIDDPCIGIDPHFGPVGEGEARHFAFRDDELVVFCRFFLGYLRLTYRDF